MSGGDINKECIILQDFFKTRIQIQKDKPRKPKNKTKKFKVIKETQMTDETKKLFDAPWKYAPEQSYLSGNGCGGIAKVLISRHGNRLVHLPELYDALMDFVVNDCPHAFISNDECRLCPDKKCKTREAVELLRKVRDGE